MTEEEKQIVEAAKSIIKRDEEKQLLERQKDIVEKDKAEIDKNSNRVNGLAIASMVVGIIAILVVEILISALKSLATVPFLILMGIGTLALGLGLFALRSKKENGKGMAWDGIIAGACTIILCIITVVFLNFLKQVQVQDSKPSQIQDFKPSEVDIVIIAGIANETMGGGAGS